LTKGDIEEDRPGPTAASGLVDHFFRHEYGRVVATLTRVFGARNLEIVEDAVQGALMTALTAWVQHGLPDDPPAWLYRVAHNHVLDVLRRNAGRVKILERMGELTDGCAPEAAPPRLSSEVHDDLLRMLFVCCDEAVPQESRLVLALKTLCGFGTSEIALRLFATEANVQKRLQRARDRLRELVAGTETPPFAALQMRLPSVHEVLYLLFNEGYLSSQPDEAIRRELCEEAIRLTTLLTEHAVSTPETTALLALMLFHGARLDARVDRLGKLVLLEEQDRSLWDREMIARAGDLLTRSAQGDAFQRYHAEAAIAAEHCFAPTFSQTRWSEVADLYEMLDRIHPSPLHAMNRAVAIAEWKGPEAGLAILEAMQPPAWLLGFYLWDSVLGELHRRAGHFALARRHVERALAGAPTDAERDLLLRRLERIG
jgi:RNA polymerase sigma factor (sigma-70 family)